MPDLNPERFRFATTVSSRNQSIHLDHLVPQPSDTLHRDTERSSLIYNDKQVFREPVGSRKMAKRHCAPGLGQHDRKQPKVQLLRV
jgi:hypothetical protein